MATNVYEGLFIVDSNSYNRDPAKASGQIAKFVEKYQGEILVSRLWEERRLAYPIKGQRKGTYWLAYFRLDGTVLDKINRDFQLSDAILRSLVLKIDGRIAEAVISHALESPQKEPAPASKGVTRPAPSPGAIDAAKGEAAKGEVDKGEAAKGDEAEGKAPEDEADSSEKTKQPAEEPVADQS